MMQFSLHCLNVNGTLAQLSALPLLPSTGRGAKGSVLSLQDALGFVSSKYSLIVV